MARQYYYLIAGLPNLIFENEAKGFDFLQIKEVIRESIHPNDYRWVELLFAPIDNQNILNIKLREYLPFSEGGKFTFAQLKAEIEEPQNLSPYIINFLEVLDKPKEAEAEENEESNIEIQSTEKLEQLLYKQFYAFVEEADNQFIRQWFTFDRELRNIQSAFVARRLGTSPEQYLIGDDDITELLSKSNASDFGLRRERDYIDKLLQALETPDILDRERKLDLLRWAQVDEITTFNYFDINIILAFLLKASIVHRWMKLDTQTGAAMFAQLVSELKQTYNANEAFKNV